MISKLSTNQTHDERYEVIHLEGKGLDLVEVWRGATKGKTALSWNVDLMILCSMPQTDQILSNFLLTRSPKVLMVEFNPIIPPPIEYSGNITDSKLYGSSLETIVRVAHRYGYVLQKVKFQ